MNLPRFENKTNRTYLVRQERIKREGSPYYAWDVGVMGLGVPFHITPDTFWPESKKYAPLDWVELINNSATNIMMVINGTEPFYCVAGTIRTVDGLALRQIVITAEAATLAGEVRMFAQREPLTIDRWARKQK